MLPFIVVFLFIYLFQLIFTTLLIIICCFFFSSSRYSQLPDSCVMTNRNISFTLRHCCCFSCNTFLTTSFYVCVCVIKNCFCLIFSLKSNLQKIACNANVKKIRKQLTKISLNINLNWCNNAEQGGCQF